MYKRQLLLGQARDLAGERLALVRQLAGARRALRDLTFLFHAPGRGVRDALLARGDALPALGHGLLNSLDLRAVRGVLFVQLAQREFDLRGTLRLRAGALFKRLQRGAVGRGVFLCRNCLLYTSRCV